MPPKNNNETPDNYSPLAENVEEKQYAASGSYDPNPIPEPKFVPPSFQASRDFFDPENEKSKADAPADQTPPKSFNVPPKGSKAKVEREPMDPGYNELSNKEKQRGAEGMATAFIQGYAMLCKQGAKWVMIKPARVEKLIREGKIDPTELYYIQGTHVTAPEIISTYNQEMMEVMEVSPDFIDQVKPLLIRILMKRGLGMSDEAQLMWIIGQDVFTKGAMLVQIKKQSNEFLKSFATHNSVGNVPSPQPGTQPQTPTNDPPMPQPNYESAEVVESKPTPQPKMDVVNQKPVPRPKQPAKKKEAEPEISPALKETAPDDFFDGKVNLDKAIVPEYGNPDTIAMLDKIDEMTAEKEGVKKSKSRKKK